MTDKRNGLLTLGVLALGIAIGRFVDWPAECRAVNAVDRNDDGTQRKAFLSGGERSALLLKEISGTVKQMDGRLANIEKLLKQQAKK
jgi:hypothetical protein